MWSTIFNVAAGVGAMYAFLAWRNRDGATAPAGILEDTPVREWPKEERRQKFHYDIAKHWKAYFVGGLLVCLFGLVGIGIRVADTATGSPPSREEVIDLIAADPDNSYDRDEAECIFDFMDEMGIDMIDLDQTEVLEALVDAMPELTDAQLDEMGSCVDDESRARRGESMTDSQVRQVLIDVLVADPAAAVDRTTAACIADLLEERGVLRDILTADQSPTPELEAALLAAETICP